MAKLNEAGEVITDTLFSPLVINGLCDSEEHFGVQRSVHSEKKRFPATSNQQPAENDVDELR